MVKIGFDTALPIGSEVTKKNTIVKPVAKSNIFDIGAGTGAGSVASMPKNTVSKNIFDYTPEIKVPTTLSNPTQKTKDSVKTPRTEPGIGLVDRMKSPNVPVLFPTDRTRKQYYDEGYEESFGMKRVEDFMGGVTSSIAGTIQGVMAGAGSLVSPLSKRLSDNIFAARNKVTGASAKLSEDRPFAKSKFEGVSPIDAWKTGVFWDPDYIPSIATQMIGQIATMYPVMSIMAGGQATKTGAKGIKKVWDIAKKDMAGGMAFLPLIADGMFDDLVNEGLDEQTAGAVSYLFAFPAAAIEGLATMFQINQIPGAKKVLSNVASKVFKETKDSLIAMGAKGMKRFLAVNSSEEVQEQLELFMQNLSVKLFANPDRDLLEGAEDVLGMGFIGASPFGTLGAVSSVSESRSKNKMIEQVGREQEGRVKNAQQITSDAPSYSPLLQKPEFKTLNNTQKLSNIDQRIEEINAEVESNTLLPEDQVSLMEERHYLTQEKNNILGIQEAKYQTMEEVEVMSTPIEQISEPYAGPKEFTSKLLEDMTGKTTVSKQYIEEFSKRSDVRQSEKNFIREVLQEYDGNKINVNNFSEKLESRLSQTREDRGSVQPMEYGDSVDIFDDNQEITDYSYDEVSYGNNIPIVKQYDATKNSAEVRYITSGIDGSNPAIIDSEIQRGISDGKVELYLPTENSASEYGGKVNDQSTEKIIKDLAQKYGYTRSKERDSNGLEHYVVDLEGISEKRKDKPVPAFQRRSQSKSKPITAQEALSIVREYFSADEVPVSFVNKIITPEGMSAFGQYYNGMVTFANNTDQTTPRHEVFHAYLDLFSSQKDKSDLFKETRKTSDYKNRLGDKKDSNMMAEEYLADKFDAYVRENQMPKSLKGKIKSMFDKIIETIKRFFGQDNKMKRMFDRIVNKNRDYIADRRNFDPKFMKDFDYNVDENFDYDAYEKMSIEERKEFDKKYYAQMKEDFMAIDPVRQDLINRVAQMEHREQRLGYVGNKKMKDPAKKEAQEIKFLSDKNYLFEKIAETYNMDIARAENEEYPRLRDAPVEQITWRPVTSKYVTVAEKNRRLMERVDKTKRKDNSVIKEETVEKKPLIEKKAVDQPVKNKTGVYARQQAMKKLKNDLGLSDGDMLKYVKVDYTTISDGKRKGYFDRISARLAQVAEKKNAERKLTDTISKNALKKEINLRKAKKINVKDMTAKEIDEYTSLLETYEHGDTFLGPRLIETLENADIHDIETVGEIAGMLAKEVGISKEAILDLYRERARAKELGIAPDKMMKDGDRILYYLTSDTGLSKSTNPVLKLMVKDFYVSKMEEDAQRFYFENQFRDKIQAARKSRGWTGLWDKIAPEDHRVFDYLEAEGEVKDGLGKDMTVEELELANFLADEFRKAKEYLEVRNQLKTRYADKYVTHIQRSFLETVKHDGLKNAVKEIVKQENEVDFAYAGDTDQVLGLEKFFKYSLTRTGELTPSKNLNKVVMSYFRTFYKKKTLDKVIPKIAAYSYVLGDSNTNKFVKQWLNDKKGRRIDGMIQGGWIDNTLMALKGVTTAIDLGGNLAINLLSWVGSEGSNINASTTKELALGHTRALTKKGTRLMDKYSHVIGRAPSDNRSIGAKTPMNRVMDLMFYGMSYTTYMSQRQFFLGQMTKEERTSGEVSKERQAEIRLKMLETYPAEDGSQALAMKTSVGQFLTQYKSWAIPYLERSVQNTRIIIDGIKSGKGTWKSISSAEGRQLMKMLPVSLLMSLSVAAMLSPEDDDYSLIGRMKRKAVQESMSSLEAISPNTWLGVRGIQFIEDILESIDLIIKLEKYKADGKYGEKGDLKGVSLLKRKLTPALIRQFQDVGSPKPKKKTTATTSSSKSR